MTQEERQQLKDAICRLLDHGEQFAHIDTVDTHINGRGRKRTWEVSIRKVIEIDL